VISMTSSSTDMYRSPGALWHGRTPWPDNEST
jgi:hypothetical protein